MPHRPSPRAATFAPRYAASRVAFLALLLFLLIPAGLRAQSQAEVVRGRVTDDSAKTVVGAQVWVTRGPDRLVIQDTTDADGKYSVRFDTGTGDYLVAIAAPGYRNVRRRVQRQGTERELVADFVLARDLAMLAAVRVTATQPVRASNPVNPTLAETGGSDRWQQGVNGQVPPSVAGNLEAVAATTPGVTMGPGGPSILGAGSESNLNTLNGMGLAAGSIPRAARTETRVSGASFDPTRGGFAGANIDVRLGPGDRFYQRRNGFVTLEAPQLQFTDPVGRAVGARNGAFRGSLGADGELIRGALTYNVALDVARAVSDPATLLGADEETLLRSGIAPDSVARLIAVSQAVGLPLVGSGIPSDRTRDAITWLGRLDDTRDTLQTRALTTYVGTVREGALGFGPLAAPSAGGERRENTYGAQLTHGIFVGPGRRVLTESRLAASMVTNEVSPYQRIPGASVLVRSDAVDDGAGGVAGNDVTGLTVGGNPFIASDERRWTLEGANETAWNAVGSRHRFKALAWARGDGLRQEAAANAFGNYTYNSLADLAANDPASFTRTLVQPERDGTAWNGALALAHRYVPSRFFSVLYGARLEGNAFGDAPPRNPRVEELLGVRTGVAPTRLHVSPRLGFTYQYNRDRDNGSGTNIGPVGKFYRGTAGVVRGGIGEFRDLLRPGLLGEARAGAGLPGSTQVLSCVGDAVPVPSWNDFLANPASIPTECAGGAGGALAERAPSLTLIDEGYDVPRSWRASLDWNSNFGKWNVRVSGLASYDLSQPGTVDANFAGVERFTLADDGRPVYVSSAGIDAASGAVSPVESRRTTEFGRANVRTSDLRGYGGQLTFQLAPDVFKFRGPGGLFASAAYTLQGIKRQYRGFDGAGFGDPRVKEWAPSNADARHAFILSGGFRWAAIGTLTLFSRLQSGLPFTPIVQGDINGDGRYGDRAFVPGTGYSADPALAQGIAALRANGSAVAKACLDEWEGKVAGRNGCRGPWTQSLNMQWSPRLPRSWGALTRRVTPTVYFQNPLGGIDQLLHGSEGLRGWGTSMTPDATLLVPRGYDAASRRFAYDVNPRFGDTRGPRSLVREPFRVTIDFSVNLSTDFAVQQLRRALEPVKTPRGWVRRDADSLTAFYLSRTSNIHAALLQESDSLFLSAQQVAQLRQADSVFSAQVRALYIPLGEYLAQVPDGVAGKAALDTVAATEKAYWKVFWVQPEIADSALTPTQRDLFPLLKGMLAVEQKDRENSQWQFGNPVRLRPGAPSPRAPQQVQQQRQVPNE